MKIGTVTSVWLVLLSLTACLPLVLLSCSESEPRDQIAAEITGPTAMPIAVDPRPNAAVEYRLIREEMGTGFMDPLINVSTTSPPRGAEAQFLIDQQPLIARMIAASSIEYCDFGTDWTKGADADISHLRTMRHCALLLQYDAHRLILSAFGASKTTERLAAVLRISRHCGQDPAMSSRLVAFACAGLAIESMKSWNAKITKTEDRSLLIDELRVLANSGVFNGRATLQQELVLLKQEVQQGGRKGFGELVDAVPINPAEQSAAIAELELVFVALEDAWNADDAPSRIKSILDGIRVPKVKMLLASLDRFKAHEVRLQGDINTAIARLEAPAR